MNHRIQQPPGLNFRQSRFVAEYLVDLSAAQAAIRGGTAPGVKGGAPHGPDSCRGLGTPVGCAGTPEEVGGFMAYLCTDAASLITGQLINIDGGTVMEH